MDLLLVLIAFVTFVGLIVGISLFFDHKANLKEERTQLDWLKQQESLPKYKIRFEIRGDGTEIKMTKSFSPEILGYLWLTSKELAENNLEVSYERGYFLDHEGISYPVSNVKNARIVEDV